MQNRCNPMKKLILSLILTIFLGAFVYGQPLQNTNFNHWDSARIHTIDFEYPVGWEYYDWYPTYSRKMVDPSSGDTSLFLAGITGSTDGGFNQLLFQKFRVLQGMDSVFCMAKIVAPPPYHCNMVVGGISLSDTILNPYDQYYDYQNIAPLDSSYSNWKKLAIKIPPGLEGTELYINLIAFSEGWGCEGLVLFDKVQITGDFTVGIEPINDYNISVSPNPVIDHLNINTNQPTRFELFNARGNLLLAGETQVTLDMTQFPSGLYYILFYDKNRNWIETHTVVKVE